MKDKKFAELQHDLEEIINWFESGEVDIDEAEEKYRQGLELVAELKQRLKVTENNIKKIETTLDKS